MHWRSQRSGTRRVDAAAKLFPIPNPPSPVPSLQLYASPIASITAFGILKFDDTF